MAQLVSASATTTSKTYTAPIIANNLSEPLPPSAKALKLCLLGIIKKDYLDIFKGTFNLENLTYLQIYTTYIKLINKTRIKNSILVIRKAKVDKKLFIDKSIQFKGFTNYVIIISTVCTCLLDLITSMLLQINIIYKLATQYIQVGCILNLVLDYYTLVIANS